MTPLASLVLGVLALRITSPSLDVDGALARPHTCDGGGSSPAIAWEDVPDRTRALALILEDAPDPARPAPRVYWAIYDLPTTIEGLPENERASTLPPGARVALNSWGRAAYQAPCPPVGVRGRYVLELYALDAPLPDLGPSATSATVLDAMRGHVLDEAHLVAAYRRRR